MWLKTVLKEQWPVVLQQNDKKDLMELLKVQQFIQKKTFLLEQFVDLKG